MKRSLKWCGVSVVSSLSVYALVGFVSAGTSACGDDTMITEPTVEAGVPSLFVTFSTFGATTSSKVGAFEARAGTALGSYEFSGAGGLSASKGVVFSLEQGDSQRVVRLDAKGAVVAAWSVGKPSGMTSAGDPVQVVMASETKAYVVNYATSEVIVIDPSETGMANAAKSRVDLASLAQPEDGDHQVEPTGAVYDPTSKRLFVVLGNLDNTKIASDGSYYACSAVKSSVIAIDTATDKVTSLGGAAPGGGIYLETHNPVNSAPPVLDADGSRMFVLSGGCNAVSTTAGDGGADAGDGGAVTVGAIQKRGIETVTLSSLATKTLVSFSDPALFPASFALLSSKEAVVGFYGAAFYFDPTDSKLGAAIIGAPDYFTVDGRDLVGASASITEDGGTGPTKLVRFSLDGDAGSKTINPNAGAKSATVLGVALSH